MLVVDSEDRLAEHHSIKRIPVSSGQFRQTAADAAWAQAVRFLQEQGVPPSKIKKFIWNDSTQDWDLDVRPLA